jgi:hypothetical protein
MIRVFFYLYHNFMETIMSKKEKERAVQEEMLTKEFLS